MNIELLEAIDKGLKSKWDSRPEQEKDDFEKSLDRELTITMRDFMGKVAKVMGDIVLAASNSTDEMLKNIVVAGNISTRLAVEFFPEEIEQ